jgi:hypothetical protein
VEKKGVIFRDIEQKKAIAFAIAFFIIYKSKVCQI